MATNTIIKTISEAPIDGAQYIRQGAAWVQVEIPEDINLYNFSFLDSVFQLTDFAVDYELFRYENNILHTAEDFDTVYIGKVDTGTSVYLRPANLLTPNLTIASIDAATGRSLVSKEWVNSKLPDAGSFVEEAPENTYSYARNDAGWQQLGLELTGITSTTIGVNSRHTPVGNAVTLPAATTAQAGLMTAADKQALDTVVAEEHIPEITAGSYGEATLTTIGGRAVWEPRLTEDQLIYKGVTGTLASLQASIDALPEDLNGKTLTIQLEDGVHTGQYWAGSLGVSGFKNGIVKITATTEATIDRSTFVGMIVARSYFNAKLVLENIYFKITSGEYAVSLNNMNDVQITSCRFWNKTTNSLNTYAVQVYNTPNYSSQYGNYPRMYDKSFIRIEIDSINTLDLQYIFQLRTAATASSHFVIVDKNTFTDGTLTTDFVNLYSPLDYPTYMEHITDDAGGYNNINDNGASSLYYTKHLLSVQ